MAFIRHVTLHRSSGSVLCTASDTLKRTVHGFQQKRDKTLRVTQIPHIGHKETVFHCHVTQVFCNIPGLMVAKHAVTGR
jgi:hypothetical protein